MPKRQAEEDIKLLSKKLKLLEETINKRHRRRIRVIDSSSPSSSSSSSSRDSSPTPSTQEDGVQSESQISALESNHEKSTVSPETIHDNNQLTPEDEAALDANILDSDVLDILGDDPTATVQYGKDMHKEIVSRFQHTATNGLSKVIRKELSDKYRIPANCTRIGAPILNLEIKAALSEVVLKRDRAIEARQKQLATAISCLSEAVTEQLNSKTKNHTLLQQLMDASRIMCDIQYSESQTRRNFATWSIKKDMKEQLSNTKIDGYLFGENLSEALKAAKAVSKSGTDLKTDLRQNKYPKKPQVSQRPTISKNCNWKPPVPARRQPGPQESRQPAPQRNRPSTSYKPSPHQPRQTRRH